MLKGHNISTHGGEERLGQILWPGTPLAASDVSNTEGRNTEYSSRPLESEDSVKLSAIRGGTQDLQLYALGDGSRLSGLGWEPFLRPSVPGSGKS